MPALALADALPDFGTGDNANGTRGGAFAATQRPAAAPPPDREAECRQAVQKAVAEAEAALAERLEREHAEALAAERTQHAEALETALRQAGEEAATAIAARFDEMERKLLSRTSAQAARILGMFLTEELQSRAVDELSRLVKAALADRDALRVRVSGTALLYNSLKAKLGEHSRQLDFEETPGFDLTVQIDESVLETRLAEWSETLAEVLS